MTESESDYILNARIPPNEREILERYCKHTRQTKTSVIREYIRSLEEKLPKEKKNE